VYLRPGLTLKTALCLASVSSDSHKEQRKNNPLQSGVITKQHHYQKIIVPTELLEPPFGDRQFIHAAWRPALFPP
jgi:hypothetical protein